MRRKMERLAKKVSETGVVYFSEFRENTDNDWGYRYFLRFCGSGKTIRRWKTMIEAIEGLQDILYDGYISDGNYIYNILEDRSE